MTELRHWETYSEFGMKTLLETFLISKKRVSSMLWDLNVKTKCYRTGPIF